LWLIKADTERQNDRIKVSGEHPKFNAFALAALLPTIGRASSSLQSQRLPKTATLARLAARAALYSRPVPENLMKRFVLAPVAVAILPALTGCVTTALAPGAADVRIVRSAADIAPCTAVGNVRQPPDQNVDMRNLTVGVGGNTLFVTEEVLGIVRSGVAYRCPK
jgi:hypothetical protein